MTESVFLKDVTGQQQDAAELVTYFHDLLIHGHSEHPSMSISFQDAVQEKLYQTMLHVGSRHLKRANDRDGLMSKFLAEYMNDVLGAFQPPLDFECVSSDVKMEIKAEPDCEVDGTVQSATNIGQVESVQEEKVPKGEHNVVKGVKEKIRYRTGKIKTCPGCGYQFLGTCLYPKNLYIHLKRRHAGREQEVLALYEKSQRIKIRK